MLAFSRPPPAPRAPPKIMPFPAAWLTSSRLKPCCRPVAICSGWATARSTVTDSTPPNATPAKAPPMMSATTAETPTPIVAPNSMTASAATAAAPEAMPAVMMASATSPAITAASMAIRVHSLLIASSMASANFSSALAMSRDDFARSLGQPPSLPWA